LRLGLSDEVQKEFLTLVKDGINNPKGIPDSISRYQDVVGKSRTRLNYVIAPGLYLMSDNVFMNQLAAPGIPGYNNALSYLVKDYPWVLTILIPKSSVIV